ncbi:MAG: DEAD/DEAH box helicase, partial [Nostocaceae cyanobacterium]|nr:DEAD/DEAH box helicase [Nostocaceae cyanobacterium]
MAILHGSWLQKPSGGCLFIWGETWRSLLGNHSLLTEEVLVHPLAMTPVELNELLRAKSLLPHSPQSRTGSKSSLPTHSQIIALPTSISDALQMYPLHSATTEATTTQLYLQPWRVDGFYLDATEAMKFLSSLPLSTDENSENSFIGGDLRFWLQLARWSFDLLARCKFLPTIKSQSDGAAASWQVLLDSAVDQTRLEKFAHLMPVSCRMYEIENEESPIHSPLHINLPVQPQDLIGEFLNQTIDAQVRSMVGNYPLPLAPSPIPQWLKSLTTASPTVDAQQERINRLVTALNAWTAPLQSELALNHHRTCFELRSPAPEQTNWTLAYFLQAVDDPQFLVDAATLWQHPVAYLAIAGRTIEQPQETFLRGLGIASRLYPAIATSLETQYPSYCSLTSIQAYEFIKAVAWRFEDSGLGVILPPALTNREGWANRLGLKITAQTPDKQERLGLQSLLNFRWDLAIGGQTITQAEFNRLVALNSPLVEINGEWVELRSPDIKTAQAFFASRKDKMALSLEDALRLSTGDTQAIEKLPVVSFEASGALQELITTLSDNHAIAPLPTPKGFQGELRPYQQRGAAWLAFLERWGLGACLADDMGLGKTIQFIAFMLHLKEEEAIEKPTLLVCPTSVLGNWEREVKKFAPTLKVVVHHGDKRAKGKAFVEAVQKQDLVVTSYALIQRDLKSLQSLPWQMIVLDEAQNIKNSEAKQSQAVRQLEATFRIGLTGTPVENRLQELWSILDFLNPGYLGTRSFFQRRFAMPIEKYGDVASLTQLRSLVQPFILRRLKTDRSIIQDLPEKQEMTVFCGLSSEQATLYQQVVEASLAEIDSSDGLQRRGMILALLVKLKQICNHPAQYNKENTLAKPRQSGKLLRLQEMLEEALSEGDRALIFTQFAEWGKLLKPYLEKQLGRETLFLYGSTSKKQREEMVDRFQHDPQGPPVMILSLKAGGVGLNLTRANHVFHFDRWWNPAVENQATDRVFRIGQSKNVQVHKFVCTGTLEEKIHDMIESKKQLADQVVGAGEQWLTELDTNQLRNLLILDRSAVIE